MNEAFASSSQGALPLTPLRGYPRLGGNQLLSGADLQVPPNNPFLGSAFIV